MKVSSNGNKIILTALASFALLCTAACGQSDSKRKTPTTVTTEKMNPDKTTVQLEALEGSYGAIPQVPSRKYSLTKGDKSSSVTFRNGSNLFGNSNTLTDGTEFVVNDYCADASCTDVAALISTIENGLVTKNAYLFKLKDGQYAQVCVEENATYEAQDEAYQALVKNCAEKETAPVNPEETAPATDLTTTPPEVALPVQ